MPSLSTDQMFAAPAAWRCSPIGLVAYGSPSSSSPGASGAGSSSSHPAPPAAVESLKKAKSGKSYDEEYAAGAEKINADARLATLRRAINVLLEVSANRAERVQMLFSDTSPPPAR